MLPTTTRRGLAWWRPPPRRLPRCDRIQHAVAQRPAASPPCASAWPGQGLYPSGTPARRSFTTQIRPRDRQDERRGGIRQGQPRLISAAGLRARRPQPERLRDNHRVFRIWAARPAAPNCAHFAYACSLPIDSPTPPASPARRHRHAWAARHPSAPCPAPRPLVLDSPHSGTHYPADFRARLRLPTLRRAEDTHVEKIYAFAPALGVAWVEAHFPRIYLDANRDTTELDTTLLDGPWPDPVATDPAVLNKVRLGKGLIWKFTDEGEPIYNRLLSVDEVRARIDRCWRPYHAAVAQAIDAAHARHGYSIHINCHSMPAISPATPPTFRAWCTPTLWWATATAPPPARAVSPGVRAPARARLQRGIQPPLQGRGAGAPLQQPGAASPQHPAGDQPQAVHGRADAGAE
jgi:hypothetical protein